MDYEMDRQWGGSCRSCLHWVSATFIMVHCAFLISSLFEQGLLTIHYMQKALRIRNHQGIWLAQQFGSSFNVLSS